GRELGGAGGEPGPPLAGAPGLPGRRPGGRAGVGPARRRPPVPAPGSPALGRGGPPGRSPRPVPAPRPPSVRAKLTLPAVFFTSGAFRLRGISAIVRAADLEWKSVVWSP